MAISYGVARVEGERGVGDATTSPTMRVRVITERMLINIVSQSVKESGAWVCKANLKEVEGDLGKPKTKWWEERKSRTRGLMPGGSSYRFPPERVQTNGIGVV